MGLKFHGFYLTVMRLDFVFILWL